MDRIHEGIHGPDPQWWSMDLGSMFCIRPRKVELNSTFGNCTCKLSRNNFDRCRVYYTVKCFVQLVPPQCSQNIARQVARNISQCNSALKFNGRVTADTFAVFSVMKDSVLWCK